METALYAGNYAEALFVGQVGNFHKFARLDRINACRLLYKHMFSSLDNCAQMQRAEHGGSSVYYNIDILRQKLFVCIPS